MQYTSNYHLSKPENDDIINPNSRTGYNGNFDTIDTNLKSVSNKANTNENNIATLQSDVIDLNAKTGDDIPFESGSADSISDKITDLYSKLVGVESKTLLWTNASPSSSFAGQTVSLDFDAYEKVEVVFYRSSVTFGALFLKLLKDTTSAPILTFYDNKMAGRWVNFTSSSITFGDGKIFTSYNQNPTNDNSQLIPFKIYGIKKVVA